MPENLLFAGMARSYKHAGFNQFNLFDEQSSLQTSKNL